MAASKKGTLVKTDERNDTVLTVNSKTDFVNSCADADTYLTKLYKQCTHANIEYYLQCQTIFDFLFV